MAGKKELDDSVAAIEAASKELIDNVAILITERTNAFNRLLQKIAEGAPDLQPDLDRISALNTNIANTTQQVISATAQAKVEGV